MNEKIGKDVDLQERVRLKTADRDELYSLEPPFPKYNFSESSARILQRFQTHFFKNHPLFSPKTLDKPSKKCGASRP